ncbi:MAG: acetyl-CoA carboxylase carboxyl transferase subunit alpha, partial [Gammaproteobacteria bacterium]|nr:acetyl-CoA carboxylase carboxyl transferase subunit alpha [Gammaproteobacteria bacterium]
MNGSGLDFERPIIELEHKIEELKKFSQGRDIDIRDEIMRFEEKLEKLKKEIFDNLTPWQKVQIARHPNRPLFLDLVGLVFDSFVELHGDRCFGDDKALIGGLATMGRQKL